LVSQHRDPRVSIQFILLPVFIQVVLTFVLLFMTRGAQTRSAGYGDIRFKDEPNDPTGPALVGSIYNSQFQLPVLFYVVVTLAYLLRKTDFLFVILSFVFVAARIAHAYLAVTSNDTKLRYGAFAAGLVVLAFMWLIFAIRILLAL
jgi:hypothetical protein